MNILSFNRISKPRIEGGFDINLKPRGFWQPRVMRTDGTYRYPWGDRWEENHILNQFVDGFMSNPINSNKGAFFSDNLGNNLRASFACLFSQYWFANNNPPSGWLLGMQVGTGTSPATQSDTTLTNPKTANAVIPGNSMEMNPSTGDLVFTISRRFEATPPGGETWTEGGLFRPRNATFGGQDRGVLGAFCGIGLFNEERLQSRIVFPQPIVLAEGEILDLVCAVVVPTLAVNGLPVVIAAQNGMNISGLLKLVGTTAAIGGGDGVIIDNVSGVYNNSTVPRHTLISDWTASRAGLSTLTTHAAYNTASAALSGNDVQGVWGTYTNGSRYRDMTFTWPVGTPAANTNFRSITVYPSNTAPRNNAGYQLLLDNQMTKLAQATMALTFRWTM